MTQITATASLAGADIEPNLHLLLRTSQGHILALYATSAGGVLYWSRSTDNGATWSAAALVSNGGITYATQLAHIASTCYLADTLYLVARDPFNDANCTMLVIPYDAAAGLGAATQHYHFIYAGGDLDVEDFGANLFFGQIGGPNDILNIVLTDPTTQATGGFNANYGFGPNVSNVCVRQGSAGMAYVAWYDVTAGSIRMQPIFNGQTAAPGTVETVSPVSPLGSAAAFDFLVEIDGSLTFIINKGGSLSSVRRSGVGSYATTPIATGLLTTAAPRVTQVASGDLYVYYATTVNQPNGEIYAVARQGASWSAPWRIAGGDAGGYRQPVQNPAPSGSGIDLMYVSGTSGAGALNYLSAGAAGPPLAPTLVSPIGNETSLTPTFSWIYNQSTPNDPQKSIQIQTQAPGGNWDSGQVNQTGYTLVYGGPTLAYGDACQWRARAWDSVSNGGAGSPGPWSGWIAFAPQVGATVSITDISSGGVDDVTSPTTIGSPVLAIGVSYSHPAGHAADQVTTILWAADGTTKLESGTTALSPNLSSPSTTTLDWTPTTIQNLGTYMISVQFRDATNGLVSETAQWELDTNWAPPAPPTNFAVTPNSWNGTATINWDIGDPVTIYREQFTLGGNSMGRELVYLGAISGQIIDFPCPDRHYTYYANHVNSAGLASTQVSVDVVLPLAGDKYGVWLNDLDDPMGLNAVYGAIDSDWSTTQQGIEEDAQEVVTMGAKKQTTTTGLTGYYTMKQNAWFVEDMFEDSNGNVRYGDDITLAMQKMALNKEPLLYRDTRGACRIVTMRAYLDQMTDGPHYKMQFELHEVNYTMPPKHIVPLLGF